MSEAPASTTAMFGAVSGPLPGETFVNFVALRESSLVHEADEGKPLSAPRMATELLLERFPNYAGDGHSAPAALGFHFRGEVIRQGHGRALHTDHTATVARARQRCLAGDGRAGAASKVVDGR
jgi:hypothetical protein